MVFIGSLCFDVDVSLGTVSKGFKKMIKHFRRHLPYHFSFEFCFPNQPASTTKVKGHLGQRIVHGQCKPIAFDPFFIAQSFSLAARDTLTDLRGVKGEMLVVRCPDVTLSRPVRLLHPRFPLYIVPRGDDVFMLGATQIETSERTRATLLSAMELMNAAYALHPAFGEAELLEIGVDARPAFPDNQPRIRRIGDVIYANGLFRHGFLLAPALAQMTADLVLEGKIPEVWYEDHRER